VLTKALGAAALAMAALAGWQTYQRASDRAGHAADRAAWAEERQQAATKALADSTRYRAIETHLEDVRNEATHVLTQTRAELGARADAHRADADGLRKPIAAFAAGPANSGAAADSAATCRADAATLGALLVDGVRLQGELAGAAEHHAAEVRSLLDAWPVSPR
jgi:Flp pilus assembly protein TadB